MNELTGETRVPLKAAIIAIVSIVSLLLANLGGVITLVIKQNNELSGLHSMDAKILEQIANLYETKRDKGVYSWNRSSMSGYMIDFGLRNPQIDVPDPNNLKYTNED